MTHGTEALTEVGAFVFMEIFMANEQNLKKGKGFDSRTTEEQRKIARMGGKASGEARREKKLIKDRILERMNQTDWDEYIDGIIQRAKDSKADAEFLRDTIGEKPVEKVMQVVEDASLEKLRADFGLSAGERPNSE